MLIAVFTRDEHCPPHVHVDGGKWAARFEFSFWHDGVRLLDVVPVYRRPTTAILEEVRLAMMKPEHLRRARECWWRSAQTVCLRNQFWDSHLTEVVESKSVAHGQAASLIAIASFDARTYRTTLHLAGQQEPLEIEL